MTKTMQLPPRTKFYGWDYNTDSAWGSKCEVWLDGTDQRKQARDA
jgi:hypothetical protein